MSIVKSFSVGNPVNQTGGSDVELTAPDHPLSSSMFVGVIASGDIPEFR
jgi:hypothetical protein